ncbi:MAG: hypothetical protein LBI84_02975 [Propionibacteriaceae bacterium]|jgi:hypothetical protein|nr:hypothetical protein [Propionibacteriaceae bacterium]
MSTFRRGGPALAAGVFADKPEPTGSVELDAALAEHLADRDDWTVPAWVCGPEHHAGGWYPDVPAISKNEADRESPPAFRRRGIWIIARSLDRA